MGDASTDAARLGVPGGRDGTRRQAHDTARPPDVPLQLPPWHSPLPLGGRRGLRQPSRLPCRSRGFEEHGGKRPDPLTSLAAEMPLARAWGKTGCIAGHGGEGSSLPVHNVSGTMSCSLWEAQVVSGKLGRLAGETSSPVLKALPGLFPLTVK